ncbi:MAG: metallophosphoesterase, partial [Bradyrhizobium sp.]
RVEVCVTDEAGASGCDAIESDPDSSVRRMPTGSDLNSIGAWPERHLLGTQLGPNRNGRKW